MNMTEDLVALRKQLVSNGELGDDDVLRLRDIMYAGGMTLQKGEFLFSLKDLANREFAKGTVSLKFKELFVEAISSLLLEDENSPGEIEDREAKWLRAKIQNNTVIDDYDRALLKNLRERSINYPSILNYKNMAVVRFEKVLYFTRYLTLFAVFGSLLSACALFIKGSTIVYHALKEFVVGLDAPVDVSCKSTSEYEPMLEMFVSSVDVFLFAMVMVIFGVGIYELFISKIDPVLQKVNGRPSWMQISNVDDLKSSLGKVILMVLIVSFFKHSIEIQYECVNDLLKLGFGIVLIALALFITSKAHSK